MNLGNFSVKLLENLSVNIAVIIGSFLFFIFIAGWRWYWAVGYAISCWSVGYAIGRITKPHRTSW